MKPAIVENSENVTQINDWLSQAQDEFGKGSWQVSLDILEKAVDLADSIDLRAEKVKALLQTAKIFNYRLNYSKALLKYNEALSNVKQLNNRVLEADILLELSKIYTQIYDYESALELLYKCVSIFDEINDKEKVAHSLLQIGIINAQTHNYDKAVIYLTKAKGAYKGTDNPVYYAKVYRHLAEASNKIFDRNKAFYYCLKSLEVAEAKQLVHEKRKNYSLLANIYKDLGQYKQALKHYLLSLREAEKVEESLYKGYVLNDLADFYYKIEEYHKALDCLNNAVKIAILKSENKLLCDLYLNFSRVYEGLEDFKSSLSYYKKYTHIENTLSEFKVRLKTEALEAKYDFEKAQKQKFLAIESLKLKDQFLSNISHEIKTPMHGILGMTDLLLSESPLPNQVEQLNSIKKSANQLLEIIEDILYLSKINAGKIKINEKEFEIERYIRQLFQILDLIKKDKPISLTYEINENVPPVLIGDPHRLLQILINLLNNAVKFTHQGEVKLTVNVITKFEKKLTLRFTVHDTGIGIEQNNIDRIFKAFEQIDNSDARKYEGTGIGLNIVKNIVNLFNGNIRVESELGKGSKFHVELPFTATDKAKLSSFVDNKVKDTEEIDGARILIAEDNQINQLYVKRIFDKWGGIQYRVVENGMGAITALKQQNFDLILMDLQMPEMGGIKATQYIRTKLPDNKRYVPIIALTANDSPLIEEQVIEAGMNAYLFKPFDEHELFHAIRPLLNTKLKEEQIADTIQQTLSSIPQAPSDLLAELSRKVDGNKAYMAEFIGIFLDQFPEAVTLIAHHLSESDWVNLQRVAHRIKSTINIVGLTDLYNVISTIDKHALSNPEHETIEPLFKQFKEIGNLRALQLEKELEILKLELEEKGEDV